MVSSSGFIVFPLAVFLHYIRKEVAFRIWGFKDKQFCRKMTIILCMYFLSQKLYTEHETCLKEETAR